MATYGYARVSTTDQDLTIQEDALRKAGCTVIRSEKATGTKLEGRRELATLLDFLTTGDVLVITRLDRLARSMDDLSTIAKQLQAKGVELKATEQPIDTSSPAGKAFFQMLGVFAEFETNLRRERQLEGIAQAKKAGVYKGRKQSIDAEKIKQLQGEGVKPAEIARRMGIARSSVYRLLQESGN